MFQESKRQLVGLVFTVISVVVFSSVARFLDDPDALRTLKMKTALKVKTASNKAALGMLNIADQADAAYEKERL